MFVSQVFATGDSLKTYLVGIVIPRADTATKWAKDKGDTKSTYEEICKNPEFKMDILRDLAKVGKAEGVYISSFKFFS